MARSPVWPSEVRCSRYSPEVLDQLPRQGDDDRQHQDRLRQDHGGWREQEAERSERPRARQDIRKTASPATTGGRPIMRVDEHHNRARPGKRASASSAPSGRPIRAASATADRVTRKRQADNGEELPDRRRE
jgi:hypothetical protein